MVPQQDKSWTKGSRREKSQFVLAIGRRKTKVRLTFGKVILGRHPKLCNIIFSHPLISRQHCGILVTLDEIHLQDFKSRNGTLVNGNQMDHCQLTPGDLITIGNVEVKVLSIPVETPLVDQSSQHKDHLSTSDSTDETHSSETDMLSDDIPIDLFSSDESKDLPENILNTMFDFDDD